MINHEESWNKTRKKLKITWEIMENQEKHEKLIENIMKKTWKIFKITLKNIKNFLK